MAGMTRATGDGLSFHPTIKKIITKHIIIKVKKYYNRICYWIKLDTYLF